MLISENLRENMEEERKGSREMEKLCKGVKEITERHRQKKIYR